MFTPSSLSRNVIDAARCSAAARGHPAVRSQHQAVDHLLRELPLTHGHQLLQRQIAHRGKHALVEPALPQEFPDQRAPFGCCSHVPIERRAVSGFGSVALPAGRQGRSQH